MRILMLLTPEGDGEAPELERILRLERFVGPFYAFKDAGASLVLASPEGGFPWMGLARHDQNNSVLMRRFRDDARAREELTDTLRVEQIFVEDFDAAFCLGKVGRVAPDASPAGALLGAFLRSGRPVAIFPGEFAYVTRREGDGLVIAGDKTATPGLTAWALLEALRSLDAGNNMTD